MDVDEDLGSLVEAVFKVVETKHHGASRAQLDSLLVRKCLPHARPVGGGIAEDLEDMRARLLVRLATNYQVLMHWTFFFFVAWSCLL